TAWKAAGKPVHQIQTVSAEVATQLMDWDPGIQILDVRKESEYVLGHLAGSRNLPLDQINEAIHSLNKEQRYYVYCAGGYRSMIFISILKARGFHHLFDITGGYQALKACSALVLEP
ncbi:MAG TPA: rhodanese-like domain-containing protein, partial [Flavisolibacter sp.]|nr:rhodanese-like domain-containing protein [Flavisolibacter sp.]